MTEKHTQGPWKAVSCGIENCWCRMVTSESVPGDEGVVISSGSVSAKNAPVIAAAPELLEALQATRGQWIHSVNADLCIAAIAKALGDAA